MPFQYYPDGGRTPLGRLSGANARHEYGKRLAERTGVTWCAYCGLDLFADYERWLLLQVDHVVPTSSAIALGIPKEWAHDHFNAVLACAGCNGFDNRYALTDLPQSVWTLEEFLTLRDKVYLDRWERISQRRQKERALFDAIRLNLRARTHPTPMSPLHG
jgi:hypothetical protein